VIAPPRTSTLVRVAVITVLAGCALSAVTAGLIYGSVTGVGDAARRAAALQRVHGDRPARITRGERVARAIVAVEDKRFWEHGALDPLAIGRVVLTTLRGGADPGGSTIAVQLAKVLYPEQTRSFAGALQAIALAFKLEDSYPKRRILSMYLNTIYFGHGFYGVERASQGYFAREPRALSWAQATLLAGLPQAPSAFDPLRYLERAKDRQTEVLSQLVAAHELTAATARRVAREPLHLSKVDSRHRTLA
jgi:membrane peptidoglycan carboxypeptidase